jgi:hypothetical protein
MTSEAGINVICRGCAALKVAGKTVGTIGMTVHQETFAFIVFVTGNTFASLYIACCRCAIVALVAFFLIMSIMYPIRIMGMTIQTKTLINIHCR